MISWPHPASIVIWLKRLMKATWKPSMYRKNPKLLVTQKNYCNYPKVLLQSNGFKRYRWDVKQFRPRSGAVWSGSTLFAQTYLSENLGSLRYSWWMLLKSSIPITFSVSIFQLLDLQLNDSNFRRYVLVQFLILFQYINAPIKFKG